MQSSSNGKIPNGVFRLSKSKLMAGIQCSKRLYLEIRQPDLATPTDVATQAVFDQGHAVGIEAQKLFPGGVLIDAPYFEPSKAVAQTDAAIKEGVLSIYEAAFIHEDVVVRVDILHRPRVSAPWQIIEVKSTTQAKEQHIQDVAIQTWVLRGAGLKVTSASVMHLNNQFVFPDGGELFARVDVTDQILETVSMIPNILKNVRVILSKPKAPATDIGPHCSDPYDCEFQDHCWSAKKLPEISIFDLPGLAAKRKWEFYKDGILALSDPRLAEVRLNSAQTKMIKVTNSGTRLVDHKGVARDLRQWKFPLYFLDFETISPALPRYPGTRPFQQIPFQFSCHIQKKADAPLLHREYLHDHPTDPREALANELVDSIGQKGSVVAYNKAFEARCLTDLAEALPCLKGRLLDISERLVDPLPIVRAHVYDREFAGSFSIKAVAPALLGDSMSYEGMEVSNGTEAQVAFEKLIAGQLKSEEQRELKQQMLEYCRKDTIAMVNLYEWLRNAAATSGESAA